MQVVILGSGRCGTVSLTELIDSQEGWTARHERRPMLPWYRDMTLLGSKLKYWQKFDKYAEAGFYFLPYVDSINTILDQVKFVCLQREKRATVLSYLEKTDERPDEPPRNHWVNHDGDNWRLDPRWDDHYPNYARKWNHRRSYISRYYDHYYEWSHDLAERLDNFWVMNMDKTLNTTEGQELLFERLEIDDPKLRVGIRHNEGGNNGREGHNRE